jgi:hypothetical protein
MVFLSFIFYGWGVRCLICEDKKEDKKGWAAFCESKKRTLASSFLDMIFDFLFLFQGLGWEGLGSMRVRGVTSWDETRPFPDSFSYMLLSLHFPIRLTFHLSLPLSFSLAEEVRFSKIE